MMVDNTKWLEPPDPAPEEPERDIVWELDVTLTLDDEGMWVAQGIAESVPCMYPEDAVKDLFRRINR